jgi:hypothetical protein
MSSGDCPSLNEVLQQLKVTLRKIRTLNGKSSKAIRGGGKAKVRGNH